MRRRLESQTKSKIKPDAEASLLSAAKDNMYIYVQELNFGVWQVDQVYCRSGPVPYTGDISEK